MTDHPLGVAFVRSCFVEIKWEWKLVPGVFLNERKQQLDGGVHSAGGGKIEGKLSFAVALQ